MINRIKRIIKQPGRVLIYLASRNIIPVTDKYFIKKSYQYRMNTKINLSNPQTFNEKLQWLKLNNRNPEYTKMVDKYEAKKYVAEIIGQEYIIPTIGVYEKFEEIDFDKLPEKFVIKANHLGGGEGIFIVKDKSKIDKEKIGKTLNKLLKKNYYYAGREWPYKNVKPRIIVEEYKEDKNGELLDYKIYAFNGRCEYVMACKDRIKGNTKFFFFDRNWKLQKEMTNDGIKYGDSIKMEKPVTLNKMFDFASILSKDIPFVRVDLYEVDEKLFFGELTFFPSCGFDNNRRKITDKLFSESLKIQ